jgi:hypothetical protein
VGNQVPRWQSLVALNSLSPELIGIPYREAIEDPAGARRTVNEFLSGVRDEAAMREATDASLYRSRKR